MPIIIPYNIFFMINLSIEDVGEVANNHRVQFVASYRFVLLLLCVFFLLSFSLSLNKHTDRTNGLDFAVVNEVGVFLNNQFRYEMKWNEMEWSGNE